MVGNDPLNNFEEISDSDDESKLSKSSLESFPSGARKSQENESGTDHDPSEVAEDPFNDGYIEDLAKEREKFRLAASGSGTQASSSVDSPNLGLSHLQNLAGYRPKDPTSERAEYSETYGSKYLSEYLQYHPDKARQLSLILDHGLRKKKLEEIFPENDLKTRLSVLETTQISIERFANGVIQYAYPPGPILQLLLDVFVSLPVAASSVRLAIFYVYNHLIQTLTNENVWRYNVSFHYAGLDTFCIPAIIHTNKIKCNNIIHICNCINIWRQRCVYTREVCDRLEHISTNTSIIQNEATVQHNFNINDELGYLGLLYHIFKMPLVDEAYERAVSGCDVERLISSDRLKDKEFMDKMMALNKEHEFTQAGRLSGQELIILHSACLDLGALIKENDHNFGILMREINKLNALLTRK